ncbi:MAG: N-6 DNA methylase [Acidimicrobiales bacterium]|nr:N-6 DNA methylase [Acidimicrobiales bacterium]HCK74184.1 hypothetical protein [Acidimicrobiaceae bacterium]
MGAPTSLRLKSELLPGGLDQAIKHLSERIRSNPKDNFLEDLAQLGRLRQASMSNHRRSGAVFTPYAIAEEIVKFVDLRKGDTVCDPAVGPGVFLLAAAERKMQLGESVSSICATLRGVDLDPVSIEVARATLQLWAAWRGGVWPETDRLLVGDGLLDIPDEWHGTCDVVIGNPPYLGQLKAETTRSKRRAELLRQEFTSVYGTYIDESMLFLVKGTELASPSGRVALIIPASLAGSKSTQIAREWIDRKLPLQSIWVGGRSIFDIAAVDVVAPLLAGTTRDNCTVILRDPPSSVELSTPDPGCWSALLAGANDVPIIDLDKTYRVKDVAAVTADFRDAYYWLADRVVEGSSSDPRPKLATVGLIDPFLFMHGKITSRFAKQRFQYPVLEIEGNPPEAFQRWLDSKTAPKLLVATQTRIVECFADAQGRLLPSTPLLSVVPADAGVLWHLLAAIMSPPAAAWLIANAAGTGLSGETIRIRASLLSDLPLPEKSPAWDEGAALAQKLQEKQCHIDEFINFAELMNQAYNSTSEGLLTWWIDQIQKKLP